MNKRTIMSKLSDIVRRNSLKNLKVKKNINNFCDAFGLVYFGMVDQHSDDHKIVRGLTASTAHIDEHYSVGSFDDYDISLVYRTDSLQSIKGQLRTHSWLILEIGLKTKANLPHVFVGDHDHTMSAYGKLFVTHPAMQKVPLGTHGAYSEEFTRRYSIYAQATHFINAEQVFTAEITRTLAAHFWPLSLEVFENSLYIYSDNHEITPGLLETMLKNGLWLAGQIDNSVETSN